MTSSFNSSSRPKLACEIAADRVIAGRVADAAREVEVCATQELAPGSVIPDLVELNLRERNSVLQNVRESLGRIGARSRDVIAILPDAAV